MRNLSMILLLLFLFSGCSRQPIATVTDGAETPVITEPTTPEELFSERDFDTTYTNCTAIDLSDSGKGTVAIEKEGSYLLTGELSEGMILVDAPKDSKIQLILNGVSITSPTSAPIYIRQADKVFITLAENSQNLLQCGESFESIDENNIDGAIFSKEDLTLNGSGSLTLHSPAGHGIVSKDDLRITGGSYDIYAAGHGLSGKDALSIHDGSFLIQSGKDGIHAEHSEDTALGNLYLQNGSYEITSTGDGISASGTVYISGGDYTLLCGGGSENGEEHMEDMFGGGMGGFGGRPDRPEGRPDGRSMDTTASAEETISAKGVKSVNALTLTGGSFRINSADDGIHSNGSITVTGGSFQIATGDDGFHADDALNISGGTIRITESYEGLEGLTISVSGGETSIKASDDGLNAAGGNDESGFGGRPGGFGGFGPDQFGADSDSSITISGGKLYVDADGDGIDSNGDLTFTGGYTVVEGPTSNGNGPLDYGGAGTLSGGTVLITGSSGMAQSLESSKTQGIFAVRTDDCPANTAFTLFDASGSEILSAAPKKAYSSIIISTPDMLKGENYTITIDGESSQFQAQ